MTSAFGLRPASAGPN